MRKGIERECKHFWFRPGTLLLIDEAAERDGITRSGWVDARLEEILISEGYEKQEVHNGSK